MCRLTSAGTRNVGMLFSAHVVDTSPLKALRRKTPQPNDVSGLRSARNATAAPFTKGFLPRPQFRRETLVACWEDEASLDAFLADDPTGQAFGEGWHVRMELVRSTGIWPGLEDDLKAERRAETAAGNTVKDTAGPSIAITIGTAYLRTAVPFLRVNNGLENQFLDTPSGRWGTAFTNLPQLLVGTLTVWDSLDAAYDYMRKGAHGAAMKDHYDPRKDPTGHTYVTDGGFFGFTPLSEHGSLGGKNPIPAGVLA